MDIRIVDTEIHDDERGRLVVFHRHQELPEDQRTFGQIYFVTFKRPGVVRGNHYHESWREWFGVVAGRLEVALRDVRTGEEQTVTLDADEDRYVRLEIGPGVAHAFRSTSEYAALLNYADHEWDPNDSFPCQLLD